MLAPAVLELAVGSQAKARREQNGLNCFVNKLSIINFYSFSPPSPTNMNSLSSRSKNYSRDRKRITKAYFRRLEPQEIVVYWIPNINFDLSQINYPKEQHLYSIVNLPLLKNLN